MCIVIHFLFLFLFVRRHDQQCVGFKGSLFLKCFQSNAPACKTLWDAKTLEKKVNQKQIIINCLLQTMKCELTLTGIILSIFDVLSDVWLLFEVICSIAQKHA